MAKQTTNNYPLEHRARITDYDGFEFFKQRNNHFQAGIHGYFGFVDQEDTSGTLVSISFDAKKYSPNDCRDWLMSNAFDTEGFWPVQIHDDLMLSKDGSILVTNTETGFDTISEVKTLSNDVKSQRFKKDLIRVGKYSHPKADWKLDVTKDRLNAWCTAFSSMKSNGVDIEVVEDHSQKAEDVRGYLENMFIEDDTLYGILEIRGDKGLELVDTVKNVSVGINPNFKDGKGNVYPECIEHIGIVQKPVVTNQQEFMPIAASLNTHPNKYLNMYYFDLGDLEMENILKEMRATLGDDLTQDNFTEKFNAHVKSLSDTNEATTKEVATLKEQIAKLQKVEKKEPEKKVASLNDEVAKELSAVANERLEVLVEKGTITPAVKDKVKELFIGETDSLLTLSLQPAEGGSVLNKVLEVLKMAKPPANQKEGMELSNIAFEEGGDKVKDEDVTKDMIAMANC
jgi:hypothetical protein